MTGDPVKPRFAFRHCPVIGAGFALLAYAAEVPGLVAGNIPAEHIWAWVVPTVVFGAFVASLCSIAVVPLLRRKSRGAVIAWLLTVVSPVVVLCAVWPPRGWLLWQLLAVRVGIPMLATLVLSLVLRFMLPDTPLEGHCPNCDYNVTGNLSGVCPECGTDFDPTILLMEPPDDGPQP